MYVKFKHKKCLFIHFIYLGFNRTSSFYSLLFLILCHIQTITTLDDYSRNSNNKSNTNSNTNSSNSNNNNNQLLSFFHNNNSNIFFFFSVFIIFNFSFYFFIYLHKLPVVLSQSRRKPQNVRFDFY